MQDLSIFLAQLFGWYLVICAIALFANEKYYMEMVAELKHNRIWFVLFGCIYLVLGLILVMIHNIWIGGWQVVVTLLAWSVLVKSIIYFVFPRFALKMIEKFHTNKTNYRIRTAAALLVGLYLLYQSLL